MSLNIYQLERVLLIDDQRCLWSHAIARNGSIGLEILEKLKPWNLLFLDHDLGESGPQGSDITKQFITRPNIRPIRIKLITGNPDGRIKMENDLKESGYEWSWQEDCWRLI
jgi:hypothetical protein